MDVSSLLVNLGVGIVIAVVTVLLSRYYGPDPYASRVRHGRKLEHLKEELKQLELEHANPLQLTVVSHRILLFHLQYYFGLFAVVVVISGVVSLFGEAYPQIFRGGIYGLLGSAVWTLREEHRHFARATKNYEQARAKLEAQIAELERAL